MDLVVVDEICQNVSLDLIIIQFDSLLIEMPRVPQLYPRVEKSGIPNPWKNSQGNNDNLM